jgi:DNA polymerase zeta
VLQTKKRYVGYMYESLDQKDPVFDAKGIETVRRDGCTAVSKVTGQNLTDFSAFSSIAFTILPDFY